MALSLETFRARLSRFPAAKRYWIAYSGGLDSHVLLHLCTMLRSEEKALDFIALHIHHGLLPEAEAWTAHCAEVCRALNVPLVVRKVEARPGPGESPEEAARNARYQAFKSQLGAEEALLTAQHQDDQAETVLLQLFRGAGLAGLAGMPERSILGKSILLRPLLTFARGAILEYAAANQLAWVEDPSNRDMRYDRNYLRHRILPLLKERWPGIGKALQRSARHCAEGQSLLNQLAADLCRAARHPSRQTLRIAQLQSFDKPAQRLVIREWIRAYGYRPPPAVVLERILDELIPARRDRSPKVAWQEGEVRRYRDEMYLLSPLIPFDEHRIIPWDGRMPLPLPGDNGALEARPSEGWGISAQWWQKERITVRFRRGGETCRLPGREGTQSLKNLYQEQAVPPWVRERMPLVYLGERLAAVGDLWVCEPFAEGHGRTIRLRWSNHGLGWEGSD